MSPSPLWTRVEDFSRVSGGGGGLTQLETKNEIKDDAPMMELSWKRRGEFYCENGSRFLKWNELVVVWMTSRRTYCWFTVLLRKRKWMDGSVYRGGGCGSRQKGERGKFLKYIFESEKWRWENGKCAMRASYSLAAVPCGENFCSDVAQHGFTERWRDFLVTLIASYRGFGDTIRI